MSKKKNVRRKKSNNLLKGVAAAGAVVGGGTIFAGNNAVYAAELDNETGVNSISESQASTSSYMSESLSQSDSTTEDYTSIENSTNASVSASAYDSTVESENNSIVESNSISDSVSLSESQLTSTSESESTSVSVSDSESLVNSEIVKNDEVSSNKFGNLITGLFTGNKNVSAANYATPTGNGSAVLTAESGSVDIETSMKDYFKESTARSESLTSEYGKVFASEVLTTNSYIVEGDNDLIKKGVLVQKAEGGYRYTYITNSNETKTIDLNERNVIKDKSNNITGINWNGYWIKSDGTIEKISSLPDTYTDHNDKSGNKEFMTIKENGQDKNVYVVKKNGYWVPIKVNDNYVEIQEKGNKIYNEKYGESYVQIKIGEKNIIWMGPVLKIINFLH